jgi:small subunit ribosomal protein S20
MPRIKSSIKDVRRTKHRRTNNKQVMSSLHTALRNARSAAADKKTETLKTAISVIDKAVQNGYIHRNTGSRYKSRLSKVKAAAAA